MKIKVIERDVWFFTTWTGGPGHRTDEPQETVLGISDFFSLGFPRFDFGLELVHGQIVAGAVNPTKITEKVEVKADDGKTHHVPLCDLASDKKLLVRWAKHRFENFTKEWERQMKNIEEEINEDAKSN